MKSTFTNIFFLINCETLFVCSLLLRKIVAVELTYLIISYVESVKCARHSTLTPVDLNVKIGSSIVIEVSEPFFIFLRTEKNKTETQQKHNKNRLL